jgi:hypothetical protein
MPGNLNGPGIGLGYPSNYYPSELQNAPQDPSSNRLALAPGDTFVIQAGDWIIGLGMYCVMQFLDPVTNTWVTPSGAAWNRGMLLVASDGFNVRIANLTGCVVSAAVIVGGTGYVQATTTITAIGAFVGAAPTLLPIVGGAVGLTGTFTVDVPIKGAGYGLAPIVMIPPPPPAVSNANGVGGIQATAIAVIAGGTISSISITSPGAGYPTAPPCVVVPSPFDPNLSVGITAATVSLSLTSAGVIMGALVTNTGSPLPNGSLGSVTLTIGGAGTSGSLTANVMQTVVSATVSGTGTGYGTTNNIVSNGGAPLAGSITNGPDSTYLSFLPRQVNISSPSITAGAVAAIYDGGLFEATPNFFVVGTLGGSVAPTLAVVMGSRPDIAIIQPGP